MIDYKKILGSCNIKHIIIREKETYQQGNDIDILTDDIDGLSGQIFFNCQYLLKEYAIEIKRHNNHTHIDISKGNILELRFDLVDTIDSYKSSIYDNNPYSHLGLYLLEYGARPDKIQHLKYVKEKLKD